MGRHAQKKSTGCNAHRKETDPRPMPWGSMLKKGTGCNAHRKETNPRHMPWGGITKKKTLVPGRGWHMKPEVVNVAMSTNTHKLEPCASGRSARHLQIKTKLLKKKTANPRARIAARFNLRVAKTLSLGLGGLIGGNAPTGHSGD